MENMKPFVDSADAINTPDVLRERMARDGYLFISGLLPKAPLREVYDAIMGICQKAEWADGNGKAIGRPKPEGDPEYWDVYGAVQRLECFHALAHRPELIKIIEALVQDDVLVHPRNIARIGPPNATKFTTPPHQDFVLIQATPKTYTGWFPLEDTPIERGGLAVLAGSHKLGLLPIHKADGPGGIGVDTEDLGLEWHTQPFNAGDVLIFHSVTVHKALPNVTADEIRLSVDYRYQGVSQPIVHDGLDPHYNLAGWPAIYRGWEDNDLKYYWRKFKLTVVPRDASLLETH
jgi:Phytanoyl-CoA dioxygenase (PhyH)